MTPLQQKILDSLPPAHSPMGVTTTDLARQAGCGRPYVYLMLTTWEAEGLVERINEGRNTSWKQGA